MLVSLLVHLKTERLHPPRLFPSSFLKDDPQFFSFRTRKNHVRITLFPKSCTVSLQTFRSFHSKLELHRRTIDSFHRPVFFAPKLHGIFCTQLFHLLRSHSSPKLRYQSFMQYWLITGTHHFSQFPEGNHGEYGNLGRIFCTGPMCLYEHFFCAHQQKVTSQLFRMLLFSFLSLLRISKNNHGLLSRQ